MSSTINPNVPATDSALISAPIRDNFTAAYNDINGIEITLSGLGNMSTQSQNNVTITGGTITANGAGITHLTAANIDSGTAAINVSGNSATVTTINGKIEAGTSITITGSGTTVSPYNISAVGGTGTVTSVGVAADGFFVTASGSPIESSGTITLSDATHPALTLIGNPSGSIATPTDIELSGTLVFSSNELHTAALTGDVTTSANSFVTSIVNGAVTSGKIAANAVTNAKMATGPVNNLAGYDNSGNFSPVSIGSGLSLISGELDAVNSGTVTTLSVVSANGFSGTVANASTTPAITLRTTITGILKGNGTAISEAIADTDYQAPITLTTTGRSGAATLIGDTLNIPEYAGTSIDLETDGTPNADQSVLNLISGENITLTPDAFGGVTIDASGGGGTPGGSDKQIQFNDDGSFGGMVLEYIRSGSSSTLSMPPNDDLTISASGTDGSVTIAQGSNTSIRLAANAVSLKNNVDKTYDFWGDGVNGALDFSDVDTSDKTYTVPNTSGTWALLEADNDFSGDVTFDNTITISDLTASQLTATDASKKLQSLDTSTYPSLTEISYVKGVTSAIQTQIDGKQPSGSYVTSVSGTSNRVTSTGGATPVIDISASYVGQSSITTLGTLTTGATGAGFTVALGTSTITGVLGPANGGTGIANNAASTLTISGNFGTTFTVTGTTSVTLPTSGTLVNTAVTTLSSLTSIGTIGTGVWQGTKIGLAYGGTNADLSATGGASQVVKQISTGAAFTVGQLAASDLSNGTTGSGAVVLAAAPALTGNATAANLTASGTLSGAPISVAVSGTTKTLALSDANTLQDCSNGSPQVITIPPNGTIAFPVGTVILFQQIGAGQVSVVGDTGVTVNGVVTGTFSAVAQYSAFYIVKEATNTWVGVSGSTTAPTTLGKVATYNGVSTAGQGVPSIYGFGRATAQVAANASVATYTVGASDGSFLVSANILVTTSSAEAFTATCTYTDEGNTSRTLTLNFSILAGTLSPNIAFANGAVPYEGLPAHIRCKASTAITIKTAAGGTYTGCTYNVEGAITQIA